MALGKSTVDPYGPGAKPQARPEPDIWKADSRLAQKVAYQVSRKTVLAILADLQAKTGVPLKAGYNSRDWQVRDRKMIIFAEDMPLADLMQSIARVMKFKWDRSGEAGKWSYRLFMDRRTVLESEAETQRAEQRYLDRQAKKRNAMSDKLSELSKMSDAEVGKLRQENPYLYFLAKSGLAEGLSGALNEWVLAGAFANNTGIGWRLAPGADGFWRKLVNGGRAMESALRGESSLALTDKLILSYVEVNRKGAEGFGLGSDAMFSQFLLGTVTVEYEAPGDDGTMIHHNLEISLMDPESSLAKGLGNKLASGLENASSTTDFSFVLKPDEMMGNDFGEKLVKHEDDPSLGKEIKFKSGKDSPSKEEFDLSKLDGLLACLSEASGLNVVSDALGKSVLNASWKADTKVSIAAALGGLSLMWNSNWWKNGTTLEFRDRYWFRKRALQIPEAYLDRWRKTFKATSTLGLDDLAEMAVLTGEPDKYDFNIAEDPILGNGSVRQAICEKMKSLQFYASLDSAQRSAALSDSGLSVLSLTAEQRRIAVEALPSLSLDYDKETLIVLTDQPKDQPAVYSFLSASRHVLAKVTAPKYVDRKPVPRPERK